MRQGHDKTFTHKVRVKSGLLVPAEVGDVQSFGRDLVNLKRSNTI